jgi:hypothetical protein
MFELRTAKDLSAKIIVTIIMEAGIDSWANQDIYTLCYNENTYYLDLSAIVALGWETEDEPSKTMQSKLREALNPLYELLSNVDCFPSSEIDDNISI